VAASAPMVSHLLFADDSLLFFKANRESADQVKDVLHIYFQALGTGLIWINLRYILQKVLVGAFVRLSWTPYRSIMLH